MDLLDESSPINQSSAFEVPYTIRMASIRGDQEMDRTVAAIA